jgi:UDP-2,3-diacylglucosamine pyrophosphatase LpxH
MRLVVLGDVHLHAGTDDGVSRDLAAVVDRYAAAGPTRLVLSGDIYDLAVAGSGPLLERLAAIDDRHAVFHDALARLCAAGGHVVLVPGNHDAEMLSAEGRTFFENRVPGGRVSPWFHREGDLVHVEHGNQYDPDNAHPHPLAPEGDPLGVLLTRRLLSRLGDLRLIPLSDRTPIPVLVHSFVGYGLRTPGMLARYVWLGLRTILRGSRGMAEARARGQERLRTVARQTRLDPAELGRLAGLSTRTTLESRGRLFRRLYLDRLLASAAMAIATLLVLTHTVRLASGGMAGSFALGALALAAVLPNRYRGRVAERLRDAAHRIAAESGVRYVVLGHVHQTVDDGVYLNTGSFGLPPRGQGRSYVEIASGGARHRTMLPGGLAPEPLPHRGGDGS